MKKVLILTNHSFMLWQFRRELIGEMLRQGMTVTVGTPFGDHVADFETMGCRMIDTPLERRGINPLRDLSLLMQYRKILKEEKPDMVITYSIKPNIYGGAVCRLMGIPYCANVQGLGTAFQKPAIAALVTAMYRFALKKAKAVFFENHANAREFCDRRITPESRQVVLRGAGVNLEYHSCQPYPAEEPTRFLYLGRLMREKGIDELLYAAERLARENAEFSLDLVGFYEDSYADRVKALEQAGIARFHGFQPEARPYYANAHCIILPSYHEGMSNVLLEAAAAGRPLITSDIPGCREAVTDGSGLLCQVRSGESLYERMKGFLQMTFSQREEMGKKGRLHMEQNFSREQIVAQTLDAVWK